MLYLFIPIFCRSPVISCMRNDNGLALLFKLFHKLSFTCLTVINTRKDVMKRADPIIVTMEIPFGPVKQIHFYIDSPVNRSVDPNDRLPDRAFRLALWIFACNEVSWISYDNFSKNSLVYVSQSPWRPCPKEGGQLRQESKVIFFSVCPFFRNSGVETRNFSRAHLRLCSQLGQDTLLLQL